MQKDYIHVQRPEVVRLYNSSMGGVDKMDFLVQLYRIFICSRKWPLPVIFHYVSVSVNNSWLEYQRNCNSLHILKKKRHDLYSWSFNIAEALCKTGVSQQRKRGRPSSDSEHACPAKKQKLDRRPVKDARYDKIDHV